MYGAKSRFMTDKVLETCETDFAAHHARRGESKREDETATVDVVAQLKEMW